MKGGRKTVQVRGTLLFAASGLLAATALLCPAGSRARKQVVPSAGKWVQATREELLASGVLAEDGAQLVFREDHTFKTPSGAAMALMGRTANGWKEWKSKFGGTLDGLKRQTTGGAEPEN